MSGAILIVDDVATNRIVMKAKLSGARYATLQAATGKQALELAATEQPGLILLDIHLPDMAGTDMITRLRTMPATRNLPVLAVTTRDDPALRLDLLHAGANDVLVKPVNEQVLLARMRSLLRAHGANEEFALRELTFQELGFAEARQDFATAACIALIAARRETALRWKAELGRFMPGDRLSVLTREDTLAVAINGPTPDIFLIEADLARPAQGLRLMSELRSRPETRYSVIFIASPPAANETRATALDLGANDLLPDELSAVTAEEAALRIRAQLARKRLYDRHRATLDHGLRLATTDPLTGLYNRRYAATHLNRMAEHSLRTERPFAVMLLDLDHFKSVNDTHGHSAGDQVLRSIAQRLRDNMRNIDLIARIGGEEFLAAMPDTTLEEAHTTAQRLRALIEHTLVYLPDGTRISITVSIGLALGKHCGTDLQALIDQADAALLGSKATGRNQVTIARHTDAV